MSNQVKQQRKILEKRKKSEQAIQNWIAENLRKPLPKWLQPKFDIASYQLVKKIDDFNLKKTVKSLLVVLWYLVFIEVCLKVFRVSIKFSTDDQKQIINVGVFHKGKYFDSYIKPEDVTNGSKKTKTS